MTYFDSVIFMLKFTGSLALAFSIGVAWITTLLVMMEWEAGKYLPSFIIAHLLLFIFFPWNLLSN